MFRNDVLITILLGYILKTVLQGMLLIKKKFVFVSFQLDLVFFLFTFISEMTIA